MALHLGDTAPDFTAATSEGDISFHDWAGDSWVVLFSHPGDFTPVCTTELGRVGLLSADWATRDVKPIAVSVDSVEDHAGWKPDIEKFSSTSVSYPIIADSDRTVSDLYDMIHEGAGNTDTVRTVFIIDPQKKVRLTMTYPKQVGRNFDEILRALDALQAVDTHGVSTPVDWNAGDRIVVPPTVSTDDAREKFDDVEEHFSYLRTANVRA